MTPTTVAVALRAVTAGDEPFLRALYSATRAAEVAAWGWDAATADAFLAMQFTAWRRVFGGDEGSIVLVAGAPAGWLALRTTAQETRLLDVALLPAYRGRGIGTALLRDLVTRATAAGRPLRLSVLPGNPALRLYQRLGFQVTGQHGAHLLMEWTGG